MSMPLFDTPPPQAFNATVTWVPQEKGELLMVDVGQSGQWCQHRADITVAVGDIVRVSRAGQTYLLDGVIAHAPAAPTPDSSSDPDGSTP